MYTDRAGKSFKHLDFFLIDIASLMIAFVIAYSIRMHGLTGILSDIYRNMAIALIGIDIMVANALKTFKNVIKDGYYREFVKTIKHVAFVIALTVFFVYLVKIAGSLSRALVILTGMFYLVISYFTRVLWKHFIRRHMETHGKKALVIITSSKNAEDVIENVKENNYNHYIVRGLILTDQSANGQQIANVPVVANLENILDYACHGWVDEMFFDIPFSHDGSLPPVISSLKDMGITVHVKIARLDELAVQGSVVEKMGNYTVLTTSMKYASRLQLIAKRALDICGGLVGCLITVLLILILGPMIYISSPGPIFFSQVRIGRNGKRFKVYKFRSMYMDAENRKKDLMDENRVSDGMMFKLDFDPRIIGAKRLPNGKLKKGIGNFIRDYSLDEFPQFFNVLKGDMSLVGTRPPTLDEWEKYKYHHRARMATKPGITGLWQVSGRSNITDFEEVVSLDREYIENWSIGADIKILARTIPAVLKKDGSM